MNSSQIVCSSKNCFDFDKKDTLIADVGCIRKDNDGLDDNDTSYLPARSGDGDALGFKIAHLSLIVIDRTKIDLPHSPAVNFNTGTDSPPQCNANAHLRRVTPVDKRQHFQSVLIFWWHWI